MDSPSLNDSFKYSAISSLDCCRELKTDAKNGLSIDQITPLRLKYGQNEIDLEQGESLIEKFIGQFQDPLIILLLLSAALSVVIGQYRDAISITLTILIVMAGFIHIAFVQEYKSSQSLEALNKLAPPNCHLTRNGHTIQTLASELVPGDIIRFGRGDRIPADCRLISAVSLEIDESNLTGENIPVLKTDAVINDLKPEISFAKNLAFMGTLVRNGHGTAVVYGTGISTELGKIEKPKTPLQNSMDELGKYLSAAAFVFIGLISLMGIYQGRNLLEVFTVAVSLAVAAIPEGLPVVVSVTLALGVLRMTKRNAIVKKLPSVESLSSVDVLCVDKTGTVTTNKMTVSTLLTAADSVEVNVETFPKDPIIYSHLFQTLLRIGNICNDAYYDEEGLLNGQPTETALLEYFRIANLKDEREFHTRLSEIPFNPEFKFMAVQSKRNDSTSIPMYYVKGAIESVLKNCVSYLANDNGIYPLTPGKIQEITDHDNSMSSRGLRVLSFAYGPSMDKLVFVGFIGFYDPPRPEAAETITHLLNLGIQVIMITGDSYGTAQAIARQVGIPSSKKAVSGKELDLMNEFDLLNTVESCSVYYRTTPTHKLRIVEALQTSGHIVAMTGDGVNDAPALRLADIGIAMGNGTDVAKEAADMILVDDNIRTLLHAIDEGKNIFSNIKNFLVFQLGTSLAALLLVAMASMLGFKIPLNPMQILWINIICDGPLAQSLGVEPIDPQVCAKPPRRREEPILTRLLIFRVVLAATIIVFGTVIVLKKELSTGEMDDRTRTVSFTLLVLFDLWNSLSCRSESRSIFSIGISSNSMYNYALAFVLGGQFLVTSVPYLQTVFQTEALSLTDWIHLIVISSFVFWVEEIRKWELWSSSTGSYVAVSNSSL